MLVNAFLVINDFEKLNAKGCYNHLCEYSSHSGYTLKASVSFGFANTYINVHQRCMTEGQLFQNIHPP